MKQILLKTISVVLVMTLILGVFPPSANTTQAQTMVNQDNITLQGVNSLGTLISAEIEGQQEQTSQMEQDYHVGYGVKNLTVDGNTVTVEYVSLEKANLVVSLYTEDGLQLLVSGNTIVDPKETVATVTLEGDIPDYFMISAYLLETYDFSPLCSSYSTPMYTREMQELLASTIDDYDPDRVLNLDDDKTTNFAVYADNVKVIERKDGVNIVAKVDDKAATYVIEKADEKILSLQTGDIFAYAYGDGQILIVKVANFAVSGSTVTISGAELEIKEVFSYVKIEATGDASDVIVDDSTVDEGITFDGLTQEGTQTYSLRRFDGEGSVKNSLNYTADKKIKAKHDEVEVTVSLKGTIGMELNIDFEYYVSATRQFMKFETDVGMNLAVSLSGKVEVELPLGNLSVMFFGVSIGFEPAVKLEVEGKVEFSSFVGFGIGYIYDNYVGLLYRDTTPKVEIDAKIEASVFIGIDLNPKIDILKGVIAKAELGAPIGLELKAKPSGTITGESADEGDTIHGCKVCVDMTLNFKVELSAKIEFLKCESLSLKTKVKAIEAEIGTFYWSLDHGDFGTGDCPYKKHRVTIQVKDSKGKLVPNATVQAVVNEDEQAVELGTTNGNGNLSVYLQAGNYTFSTVVAENGYSMNMMIEEACKVVMDLSVFANDYNTIFDHINSEDIADRGTAIASGECGDQGDNVTWKLYDNGTLVISGKGAMKDFSWINDPPWEQYSYDNIQTVIIAEGVTSIGSYAFYAPFNDTSMLHSTLPDSITNIGDYAFCNRTNLSINIPKNLTTVGKYAFYQCNVESDVCIESTTTVGEYAFANCGLKSVTIGAGVTSIGDGAFLDNDQLGGIWVDADNPAYCSDEWGVLYNKEKTMLLQAPSNISGDYTIASGVITIAEFAFFYAYDMTGFRVAGSNPAYSSDAHGVLFNKDKTVLIRAPGMLSGSYTIPGSVTSIQEFSFYLCGIRSVIIPDSVTSMGRCAFYFCIGLESLTIGSGITVIPERAFYWNSLKNLIIPDNVITIGDAAFGLCYGLATVTIGSGVTYIGHDAFDCGWAGSLTDVYYKGTEEQWNSVDVESSNDQLRWCNFHYLSTEAVNTAAISMISELSGEQESGKPMSLRETTGYSVHNGQYGEEAVGNVTVKTASFANLVPGAEYVLLVLKSTEIEDVLTSDNLLYISQATAEEDGSLIFTYIPREITEVSYVMACGASNKNLNDAVITLPTMTVGEEMQTIEPTVVYDGEVLTEGVDYIIVGMVSYTQAGEYTCYIRGINSYTGLVKCIYTVTKDVPGDVNGDEKINSLDGLLLMRYLNGWDVNIAAPEAMDVNGDGKVNSLDGLILMRYLNGWNVTLG